MTISKDAVERARTLYAQPAASLAGERRKFPVYAGKPIAMRPMAIDFDWIYSVSRPNWRTDDGVEVVEIEGPLEHKSGWWFDSYESILKRVEGAMTGECYQTQQVFEYFSANGWQESPEYEPPPRAPALAVVMRINSPGGEAAGATAAHKKIRALAAKHCVPVFAYADELACSAAYELACAADAGIWLPESGVVGSIGVIATAFDRTKQNEKIGLDIELITSGAYKADGHPDRVLDDGIKGRIQQRVNELAAIFFQVVADARDTSPEAIADLQAATFLGRDAVMQGVADGVAEWDQFLELVGKSVRDGAAAPLVDDEDNEEQTSETAH
jgi:hypothetical protein